MKQIVLKYILFNLIIYVITIILLFNNKHKLINNHKINQTYLQNQNTNQTSNLNKQSNLNILPQRGLDSKYLLINKNNLISTFKLLINKYNLPVKIKVRNYSIRKLQNTETLKQYDTNEIKVNNNNTTQKLINTLNNNQKFDTNGTIDKVNSFLTKHTIKLTNLTLNNITINNGIKQVNYRIETFFSQLFGLLSNLFNFITLGLYSDILHFIQCLFNKQYRNITLLMLVIIMTVLLIKTRNTNKKNKTQKISKNYYNKEELQQINMRD